MLKEIYCDRFTCNGTIREPMTFKQGLNVILGSENGSNSIGKSTLLMIVDFVFGGMDYIEKSKDVHINVGPHRICFTFEFENDIYHFSRFTSTPKIVDICDNKYNVKSSITLERYHNFLKEKYGLGNIQLSFRAIVGKFLRIYLRECCDEGRPLKQANRATDKSGIIELIKLFDKYIAIEEMLEELTVATEKRDTFRKAIRFSQISSPLNKSEYKKNLNEIQRLKDELVSLSKKSSEGLLDVDSVKAKSLAEIKGHLSRLYRQRTRLKAKHIALVEESELSLHKSDFTDLLQFFPNIDVEKLENIEEFHNGVTYALEEVFRIKFEEVEGVLRLCEQEIEEYELKIKQLGSVSNVSQAILDRYADIKQKHDELVTANSHFDEEKALATYIKDLNSKLNILISLELETIQNEINAKMTEKNKYVFDAEKSAPVLNLWDEKRYSFETPNDSGTGSRYKGLILFDLALLDLTPLPVIAHDSFMLKQIEDDVLEKILELYSMTSKQVFIAMDKQSSYTKRAEELLVENAVLRLSSGGNELFGNSWNVIDNK